MSEYFFFFFSSVISQKTNARTSCSIYRLPIDWPNHRASDHSSITINITTKKKKKKKKIKKEPFPLQDKGEVG